MLKYLLRAASDLPSAVPTLDYLLLNSEYGVNDGRVVRL